MFSPTASLAVEKFNTSGSLRIYRLRLEAFPDFFVYAHLIMGVDVPTLVDTGSGLKTSNSDLVSAFRNLHTEYGETISLSDVGRIIITHGHADHFGGLNFITEQTNAQIGVHELDRSVLSNYEERVVLATRDLKSFLVDTGLSHQHIDHMLEIYAFGKGFYQSVDVDFSLRENEIVAGVFQFYHVPGHCPGQVCVQVDDILLTADHVLSKITPHQSPESITRYTGLGHYLKSLAMISDLPGIRQCLGGHDTPFYSLTDRVNEIRISHEERLSKIIDLCHAPRNIQDLCQCLFGELQGYNLLLALTETGAHVEYLYERDQLAVANLAAIKTEDRAAILYQIV